MKNIFIIAIIAFAGYYYFTHQHSQCETVDDVTNKGIELAQAFVHASTAKNSEIDTISLIKEIQKIEIMKKNGFPDIQKTCEAMDNIMDELE